MRARVDYLLRLIILPEVVAAAGLIILVEQHSETNDAAVLYPGY